MPFVLGAGNLAATAQRIMYRSTDHRDQPVAVTGTVLTPTLPWIGLGPRPIVGFAAGTQGLGDQCAPSRTFANGTQYEIAAVTPLLARGYGVVVTDYIGLGTPGVHTWLNRAAEAHAVLDSIRAAQRLRAAHLPAHGPVGLWGYSQGGHAAAAAAELQPRYAPELDLKGVYAGAVPADLIALARFNNGGYGAGLIAYLFPSLNQAYPRLHIMDLLNDRGRKLTEQLTHECALDTVARHALTRYETLTKDGRPFHALLAEQPYRDRVDEQKIGLRQPAVPALVLSSRLDDIVPHQSVRRMAQQWCELGVNVQFRALTTPSHIPAAFEGDAAALPWLGARFAGVPQQSKCGSF
jgi:pimeloyl-ACP methyl ester carboxylesterase